MLPCVLVSLDCKQEIICCAGGRVTRCICLGTFLRRPMGPSLRARYRNTGEFILRRLFFFVYSGKNALTWGVHEASNFTICSCDSLVARRRSFRLTHKIFRHYSCIDFCQPPTRLGFGLIPRYVNLCRNVPSFGCDQLVRDLLYHVVGLRCTLLSNTNIDPKLMN